MPLLLFAVASPHAGLRHADWAAVALYATAMAATAWACSRKQASAEEFFLAQRRMPWFAVGLSIMATLVSTVSYVGIPGEVIRHGIGMFSGLLGVPFAMAVVLCLWVPFFMRLRVTSVYEYLEQRFDGAARLLAAVLFILLRLGWLGVIIYTCSIAVDKMVEIGPLSLPALRRGGNSASLPSVYLWIVLIGIFTTAYTSVGGVRAVIWTDVAQSMIMFAGVLVTLSYTWIATGQGPLDWWAIAGEVQRQHTSPPWFDLDLTARVTILTAALNLFFWITCTHCSDQMVVQRYFTTPSLKAAMRSFLIGAVAELTVTALLVMSGLALLAFYTRHPTFLSREIAGSGSADKWFPYFIAHQLPIGLGGLILSALFAAGMSSISSGINSVSAVLVTDIAPSGRANSNLTRARWLSLAIGVLVTALAAGLASLAQVHNITELMQKGFNIFLGPLAALFFIGMFLPRSTSRSAIPAVLFGLAVSIVWSYWRELRLPEMLAVLPDYALFQTLGIDKLVGAKAGVPTFTLAIALPWATAVLTAFLLSWIVERPGKHPGREWTWYAVMRRPV